MKAAEYQSRIKEIVYSPDPALWHPLTMLRRMVTDSWRFRHLVHRVVVRDLRAQYRQSLFGYLWAFVPAIATGVGFSLARSAEVLRIEETPVPYMVFVMVGTVLWQTFIEALNGPIEALNSFKSVLNRIYVPPEIIILAKLGEIIINLSIKLILLILILVIFKIPPDATILAAPILLLLLILEGAAIGLFLSPLAVLYHDVTKGLPVVTGFWFLLTPVAYPVPQSGVFSLIVRMNPATPFLVALRNVMTGAPLSNPWTIAVVGLVSILTFVIAMVTLRVSVPFVIERSH